MADRIEKLVAAWEPVIKLAFLDAVKTMRDEVQLADLVAMLQRNDIDGAIRVVGLESVRFRELDSAIERAFEAGGRDATAAIKPTRSSAGILISPVFDVRAPGAGPWVQQHNASLIKQITEDQRQLIAEALKPLTFADQFATPATPQKVALDLVGRISPITGRREGGILGLTSQQAQWARNYEVSLGDVEARVPPSADALTRKLRDRRFDRTVAKAIQDGVPIPAKTRQAMVAAYRNRALLYRGETIAKFEASSALHQAQITAFDQAVARGVVSVDLIRRYWVTAGDERVRPSHAEIASLNPSGVGLHAAFDTPEGPVMYPPIAPNCRCHVRIRVLDQAPQEPRPNPALTPLPAPA